MAKTLSCAALGLALVVMGLARAQDATTSDLTDDQFVLKASADGLAEVNLGRLAAKQATNPEVKKFGKHMVEDHSKANKELITLANKKRLKVAPTMDATHTQMFRKLSALKGAAFDREYMAGQLKDHKTAVSLFDSQSKNGKDEDLRKWAEKTLPTLREHLKMAQEVHGNLKDDRGGKSGE